MSTETKIDVAALRALLADYTKAEAALDAAGRDAEMPVVFAWRNARTAWWDALVAAGPALLDAVEGAGGLDFGAPVGRNRLRCAVAVDGHLYQIRADLIEVPDDEIDSTDLDLVTEWLHVNSGDGESNVTGVDAAIEAARAHDRARRGSR